MTSFAVLSGRRVPFHASTCFLIGSKFRCMRSTPTERISTRLRCFVCLASTGVKSPLNAVFEHSAHCNFIICHLPTLLLDPRQPSCQSANHDSLSHDCSDLVRPSQGATPEALIVAFCRLAKLLHYSF